MPDRSKPIDVATAAFAAGFPSLLTKSPDCKGHSKPLTAMEQEIAKSPTYHYVSIAANHADRARNALLVANNSASAVESIVIVRLLEDVSTLASRLNSLREAIDAGEDGATFEVPLGDGFAEQFSLSAMLAKHAADVHLSNWLRVANVGDEYRVNGKTVISRTA